MSLEASNAKPTIQDLPDEMVEMILLKADVADRKSSARVCTAWSSLNYIWTSAQLMVDFSQDGFNIRECREMLLPPVDPDTRPAPNRRYRHLYFVYAYLSEEKYNLMKEIVLYYSWWLESVTIRSKKRERKLQLEFLAIVADECTNLKQLEILCDFEEEGRQPVVRSMGNLEELYLRTNLPKVLTNMHAITPHLSKLNLHVTSFPEPVTFLGNVSSQLQELVISFEPGNYFLEVCSMAFPLLKKLRLRCYVENEERIERVNDLFRGSRNLKELALRIRIAGRNFLTFSQSFRNIEFLCLQLVSFQEDTILAIRHLQHLKRFRLENTYVSGDDLPLIARCENLEMFSLCNPTGIARPVKLNEFLLYTFPRLTVLELVYIVSPRSRSFALYDKICKNMTSLRRLTIMARHINIAPFLDFCASRGRPELRLGCTAIQGEPEKSKEKYSIPVETLILVAPVRRTVLQTLIEFMGLTRLDADGTKCWQQEEIQTLRDANSRCRITIGKRVQIVEPPCVEL